MYMGGKRKKMVVIRDQRPRLGTRSSTGSAFVVLVMVLVLQCYCCICSAAAQVPAIFVFGDSLIDAGNNNYLSSLVKSNYYPYGCDFRGGPTGRFSNGRTFADLLGNLLGLPCVPAFSDPNTRGKRILRGVNHASAAAGILDETGKHLGQRYSLSQQVLNFHNTVNRLRLLMNATAPNQFLAKSIALLVFGSNDYLNNYLMPSLYSSSYNYTPHAFANLLINRYTQQILALHSVGLRKFVLAGLGPLGCIPNQRASAGQPKRCVDHVNQMVATFNEGLRSLVDQLNRYHSGGIFVYVNTYSAFGDMLSNPATYGFSVVNRGCCRIGRNRVQITCLPDSVPCTNRNQYIFWDAYHPTEAANAILARRAFNGPPSEAYPINVQQMAQI